MARIPDPVEFGKRWSSIPMADRRRIVRAVNRGEQLSNKKEAALAVVLARRQQRFWKRVWIFGPLVAIAVSFLFGLDEGWVQLVANSLLGTATLTAMSLWFIRRARISEASNTAHATGRKPPPA